MIQGHTSTVVNRAPAEVWAAVCDIARMGDYSPECIGGRWIGGASGPGVGASFEGDNELKVAGRTLKKWTTTSVVSASEPGKTFEFVSENYTTWRYELEAVGETTRVTESFSFEAKGWQGFLYEKVLRRSKAMVKGMTRTLERLKATLEAPTSPPT